MPAINFLTRAATVITHEWSSRSNHELSFQRLNAIYAWPLPTEHTRTFKLCEILKCTHLNLTVYGRKQTYTHLHTLQSH